MPNNQDDLNRKLNYLNETKQEIKRSLKAKGQPVNDNTTFREYANLVSNITTGVDTSDATATSDDIIYPKTAYVNGQKITGNIEVDYINLSNTVKLNNIQVNTLDITGYCLTPDGNAGVVVDTEGVKTIKKSDNSYNIINTYSWADFGITNKEQVNNNWFNNVKISTIPIQNNVYNVIFFSQYNIVTRYNADTGELKYQPSEDYAAYYIWGNTFVGRTYTIRFSNNNSNIVAVSYYSTRYDTTEVNVIQLGMTSATVKSSYGLNETSNINGVYDLVWSSDDSKLFFTRKDTIATFAPNRMVIAYLDDNYNMVNYYRTGNNICTINDNMNLIVDKNKNIKSVIVGDDYRFTELNTLCKIPDLTTSDLIFVSNNILAEKVRAGNYGFTKINLYDFSDTSNISTTSINVLDTNIDCIYNNHIFVKQSNNILLYGELSNADIVDKVIINGTSLYNLYDSNITSNDILQDKIAYGKNGKVIGTMSNNGELNYTPSDIAQIIPEGYTSGGTIKAIDVTQTQYYEECLELSNQILGITNN